MKAYTRDVTEAYVKSHTKLEMDVHIKPQKEIGLSTSIVLKVVRLLYGILESELYWKLTYIYNHTSQLGMNRAHIDPCLLIKRKNGGLLGVVILQVDDRLILGTDEFPVE